VNIRCPLRHGIDWCCRRQRGKEGMKTTHAVYESGVFRPLETVELPERTEVEFEPRPVVRQEDRNARLDAIYA
jgi:predicted DNA-binding antitoxin AbrB/MazE fold protein